MSGGNESSKVAMFDTEGSLEGTRMGHSLMFLVSFFSIRRFRNGDVQVDRWLHVRLQNHVFSRGSKGWQK